MVASAQGSVSLQFHDDMYALMSKVINQLEHSWLILQAAATLRLCLSGSAFLRMSSIWRSPLVLQARSGASHNQAHHLVADQHPPAMPLGQQLSRVAMRLALLLNNHAMHLGAPRSRQGMHLGPGLAAGLRVAGAVLGAPRRPPHKAAVDQCGPCVDSKTCSMFWQELVIAIILDLCSKCSLVILPRRLCLRHPRPRKPTY